jgi:hypothetical protein
MRGTWAWGWWASLALFVAGVVGGTWLDPRPPRPPVHRGPWRVLEGDFHAHTRMSDGFLSPFDLVLQADRRGLDVLAVTEHNTTAAAEMARAWSRLVGGPTILIGEEVTAKGYHVHGIGLTRTVDASLPLEAVIDEVHRQRGVVIAAHPVERYWPALLPVRDRLDGAEVMHPGAYAWRDAGSEGSWRWDGMRDFYLGAVESGRRFTAIGSSDYHGFSPLGVCRTLVFVTEPSGGIDGDGRDAMERAVLDALREARTVVFDLSGRAYGDPALVALLAAEPYTPRAQDYGYAAQGVLDAVLRFAGWLGFVGLALLRRPRAVSALKEAAIGSG